MSDSFVTHLIPGLEDPLKEKMATHFSILAWEIRRTEEPRGLQSMGSQRVRYDWVTKHTHGLLPSRLLRLWDFPGKNTEVTRHFLLQQIFLTRGSNLVSYIAGRFFTAEPPGKPRRHRKGLKLVICHRSPSPHAEVSFLFGDLVAETQVFAPVCIPLRLKCVASWAKFSFQDYQIFWYLTLSLFSFKSILIACGISFRSERKQ